MQPKGKGTPTYIYQQLEHLDCVDLYMLATATLKVEVISKEIVKPSFPTSDHLHHYQLSFNDQMSPPIYNPMTLFYASKGDVQDISTRLKNSLSKILTLYYQLAGRLKDNNFINCNDEGIPFLEA
ncbi:Vinorine synthase [Morella rubra]|uniref:Vinorine synthase n=1 Tax=Morella rubra TaxID=262757 RepID=A0A6A1WBW5_9ROSI|nr:Vinorine synthase [Morella rubra]